MTQLKNGEKPLKWVVGQQAAEEVEDIDPSQYTPSNFHEIPVPQQFELLLKAANLGFRTNTAEGFKLFSSHSMTVTEEKSGDILVTFTPVDLESVFRSQGVNIVHNPQGSPVLAGDVYKFELVSSEGEDFSSKAARAAIRRFSRLIVPERTYRIAHVINNQYRIELVDGQDAESAHIPGGYES